MIGIVGETDRHVYCDLCHIEKTPASSLATCALLHGKAEYVRVMASSFQLKNILSVLERQKQNASSGKFLWPTHSEEWRCTTRILPLMLRCFVCLLSFSTAPAASNRSGSSGASSSSKPSNLSTLMQSIGLSATAASRVSVAPSGVPNPERAFSAGTQRKRTHNFGFHT